MSLRELSSTGGREAEAAMIWAAVVAYALVGFVVMRAATGHVAWLSFEANSARPDPLVAARRHLTAIEVAAGAISLLLGLVWPVVLVWRTLPGPVVGAELRAREREREAYVKELERKVGL